MKATFKSTPIPAPPPIEEVTLMMSKKSAQQLIGLLSYIWVTPRYVGAEKDDVGIMLAGLATLQVSNPRPNTPTAHEALDLLASIKRALQMLKELD